LSDILSHTNSLFSSTAKNIPARLPGLTRTGPSTDYQVEMTRCKWYYNT